MQDAGCDASTGSGGTEGAGMIDLNARREDVVRRLIERGVPERTLRALFPDWESMILAAVKR